MVYYFVVCRDTTRPLPLRQCHHIHCTGTSNWAQIVLLIFYILTQILKLLFNTTFYFMFCWPCISIYVCNETNLKHYLSSVYSVTITKCFGLASSPSSGGNNVYMWQLVRDVRLSWLSADPSIIHKDVRNVQIFTYIHCYLLMMGY
jgi:hypothetical protein